jgi:hypothetical protein
MGLDTALALLVALSLPLWLVFEALQHQLRRSRRQRSAPRERRVTAAGRETAPEVKDRVEAFSLTRVA